MQLTRQSDAMDGSIVNGENINLKKSEMLQTTRGIVLRTIKYKDALMIADVYTETSGRASFLVRVPRSRKSAVKPMLFQPLALVELEADFRPRVSLHRLKGLRAIRPYVSLPYEPCKSGIALFLSEFLCRALREEGENRPLYAYLSRSLEWLDECGGHFANFHLVFLMRLSRFLGLYPNLEDYAEGCCFDLRNACFVPQDSLSHPDYIGPQEASRIVKLMRMNYDTMHLFGMNRDERMRCLEVLNRYYRLHLPDFPELNSLEVLRETFG